jgi:Domain of unknown function(DUF2779)
MHLSKSKIMAGLQCPKRLYLQVHQPKLAASLDEKSQAAIEQGRAIGRLAQGMFPGGVLIESGDQVLSQTLARTEEALADGRAPAVFEGTFEHDDIAVRADILERQSGSNWRLLEVKSSTDLKECHVYDVAIQRFVLEGSGLKVAPCLVHLNRQYVYDGRQYELEKLFSVRELTQEISALKKNVGEIAGEQRAMLAQGAPPDIEPGRQCTDPYRCEFYNVCNQPLPSDHVANLPRISEAKLAELKKRGIGLIGDIPTDFQLTDRQRRAFECVKTGRAWFAKELSRALVKLEYPLYFMDFETLSPALPRFAGMRPYDHIPFQWSVHVQREPGGDLEHFEFLAENGDDPRPAFLESLAEALEKRGHIVVYSKSFESQRLTDLAGWLPKYQEAIGAIQSRLWDLLEVIRSYVYHPAFMGSFSLKKVLPALVPDMSYEGMEVSEGSEAGLAWDTMVRGEVDEGEKKQLREALLAYCKQDTLAMVRLLEMLQSASPS